MYNTVKPPKITGKPIGKPADGRVKEGEDATFSIMAEGKSCYYQWIRDGTILNEDSYYRGVNKPCLKISKCTPDHEGQYWCMVTNKGGTVPSPRAKLTVSKFFSVIIIIILYHQLLSLVFNV